MRKHLINARKAVGLTVAELASRVGITRQHMYRIESGEVMPSLDLALNIIIAIKEESRKYTGYTLAAIFLYQIAEIKRVFGIDESENGIK